MVSRMSPEDATASPAPLPLSEAAARRCGFGSIRRVAITGSTNDDLADEAREGIVTPALLVADHQTAGKGRRDRRWEDRRGGALLFSLRVPTEGVSAHDTATCLVASARAVADSRCPEPVLGKWPNDMVVESGSAPGKLGGVLSELIAGNPDVVVVGVGLNLEPVPDQPVATSIRECGGEPDRDRILAEIIEGFSVRRDDPNAARAELRASSATLGRRVQVDLGASVLVGTAADIDDEGHLVVTTDGGDRRVVSAGDVVHLRPADGSGAD
jgi:BirA family biotin operon repressor/biotin-[acetyl-CoA-carboxylase] ligase